MAPKYTNLTLSSIHTQTSQNAESEALLFLTSADFGDNAAYADVEGRHIVAEGLRFADKQLARME